MRYALAGGGTGGHAYPALAVAESLRHDPDTEVVYYGTSYGPERDLATQAGIPFRAVPASQVRGRSPLRMGRGLYHLWRGTRVAASYLAEDEVRATFATGGYAAAPIGRAASQQHVPLVLFLPDAYPGWAVRFLARYAVTVACAVDSALPHLPRGKGVVTGYPVRPQFHEATREEGQRRFGLQPDLPTLLIAGGSLGAHQINRVVADSLPALLERVQIIHVAGRDEETWLLRERDQLPDWLRVRYHLHAYTEEMGYAMAAADLAITRAGGMTLGELPITGLPGILIPGAFSDQHRNAQYLEQRGAAITVETADIDRVPQLVFELLDDPDRRAAMAQAMRAVAHPDAADRLATMLREAAG